MARKLVYTLAAVSLIIFCSGLGAGLRGRGAIASEREGALPPPASTIEVTFEGLMVLNRLPGDHYELGILVPELAHKHTFKVKKDGKDVENLSRYMALGKAWILEIRGSSGGTTGRGMTLRNMGQRGRLEDTQKGQFDFMAWAVDLEGPDFHDRPLTLKPGYLKPIIRLPDGELYTKYKSPMVQHKKGPNGKFSDFGFVAETTGLTVNLQQGEELVLRVEKAGQEGEIFRLPYGSPHSVAIDNPPDEPSKESHFTIYYGLFDVRQEDRFDFRLKKPEKQPLNPYPLEKIRPLDYKKWVDGLPCGKILLGRRTDPLE